MEVLKKRLSPPAELKFFGTHKTSPGGYMSNKDFSATKSTMKDENKLPRASLVFRNNVAETIAPSGKIEFAISGSRLYFRDGGVRGYTLSKKAGENQKKNRYSQVHNIKIDDWLTEYGNIDRDIKADNEAGYYYVDAEEEEEEWISKDE